jgi:hypothetical protein
MYVRWQQALGFQIPTSFGKCIYEFEFETFLFSLLTANLQLQSNKAISKIWLKMSVLEFGIPLGFSLQCYLYDTFYVPVRKIKYFETSKIYQYLYLHICNLYTFIVLGIGIIIPIQYRYSIWSNFWYLLFDNSAKLQQKLRLNSKNIWSIEKFWIICLENVLFVLKKSWFKNKNNQISSFLLHITFLL